MSAAKEHGLEYSASDGITGWDESAYYQFSTREIEEDLEAPAEELEGMCMEVVARAITDCLTSAPMEQISGIA